MNVKRYMMLAGAALMASIAMAQNTSKEIYDIKRNESYIYAEATDRDAEKAFGMARDLLISFMVEYAQGERELSDDDHELIKKNVDRLQRMQMARGEQMRVFVYIAKTDVLSTAASSPQPKAEPKPEVKAEPKPSAKPEAKVTPAQSKPLSQPLPQAVAGSWQEKVINDLLACETLSQGKAMLNRLKAEYRVKRTGYMSTCTDPAVCYLLVGDAEGKLKTVLSPGDGQRTNLRTKVADTLDNYDANTAIWFMLAK